jgi:hypothetical protein
MVENTPEEIKQPIKKPIINKYLRNFFFKAFKARKEFKGVEKSIGKIDNVTIIISKNKNILRAQSGQNREDVPFTDEEISKFLKAINVKQSSVDSCKSIFVMLNFVTQHIHIQQNKFDGTTKNFEI